MNLATSASAMAARRFLLAFALLAAAGLAAAAGRSAWFDPLWVHRASPPWLHATGGANGMIDLEMRRAKALQLMARPAPTIIMGSSVVYRGIDPDDLGPAGADVYNLGVSSMRVDELPIYAGLIAAGSGGRRIVIGLDYYMFTDAKIPILADGGWPTARGRLKLATWWLFSWRMQEASRVSVVSQALEPGLWKANGFRSTPDRGAARTSTIDAQERRDIARYEAWRLEGLRQTLRILDGRTVSIYLSPVSGAQRRVIEARGLAADFDLMRRDIAALAALQGASFFDFSEEHEFDDFDPSRGSSPFWFDNLHFRPAVGAWLLRRIGFATAGLGEGRTAR